MKYSKKDRKIGFLALRQTIGEDFFDRHQDTAVFCYGNHTQGLSCFLGIDLHPDPNYSGGIDDSWAERNEDCRDTWDVYASCFVKRGKVIMDKCRLPEGHPDCVNM